MVTAIVVGFWLVLGLLGSLAWSFLARPVEGPTDPRPTPPDRPKAFGVARCMDSTCEVCRAWERGR